jgi:acetylornithine deacetylase/succinyl-diaminopimelate desuccinylase-like protein
VIRAEPSGRRNRSARHAAALVAAWLLFSAAGRTEGTSTSASTASFPLLGTVAVTVTPERAVVRLDGRVVPADTDLEVMSGTHVVRADLEEHESAERRLAVLAGTRTGTELHLIPEVFLREPAPRLRRSALYGPDELFPPESLLPLESLFPPSVSASHTIDTNSLFPPDE